MSKHVSFPASHLSAYDIGKRIKAVTIDGATITDKLTKITTYLTKDGETALFLHFASALPTASAHYLDERGFRVALTQYVKRIDDEA